MTYNRVKEVVCCCRLDVEVVSHTSFLDVIINPIGARNWRR